MITTTKYNFEIDEPKALKPRFEAGDKVRRINNSYYETKVGKIYEVVDLLNPLHLKLKNCGDFGYEMQYFEPAPTYFKYSKERDFSGDCKYIVSLKDDNNTYFVLKDGSTEPRSGAGFNLKYCKNCDYFEVEEQEVLDFIESTRPKQEKQNIMTKETKKNTEFCIEVKNHEQRLAAILFLKTLDSTQNFNESYFFNRSRETDFLVGGFRSRFVCFNGGDITSKDKFGEVFQFDDLIKVRDFYNNINVFEEVAINDVGNSNYTATIKEKCLRVGCQDIEYSKLEEIYAAAKSKGLVGGL